MKTILSAHFMQIPFRTVVDPNLQQKRVFTRLQLGFDKSHVVVMPIMDATMRDSTEAIKAEMEEYDAVLSVGVSSHVLGGRPSGGSYHPEGYPEGEAEMMDRVSIDEGYIPTLGMEIVQGRNFSKEFPALQKLWL